MSTVAWDDDYIGGGYWYKTLAGTVAGVAGNANIISPWEVEVNGKRITTRNISVEPRHEVTLCPFYYNRSTLRKTVEYTTRNCTQNNETTMLHFECEYCKLAA